MKSKKSLGEIIFDSSNYIFLAVLSLVTIYPMIHVLFASFSTGSELTAYTGLLYYPLKPTLAGYEAVFSTPMILTGYINTFIVIIGGLALNILVTSMTAYALSRDGMLLKKPITLFVIFTMYFSGGLIPYYFLVKSIGLRDNLLVLIIPVAMSTFNMIIMRTSFEAIPVSLEESAKLDGANDFTILFKIILPLSKAVIAVMCLYYGVAHWNSWFQAMIFISDRKLYPLQLVLREILLINQDNANVDNGNTGGLLNVAETLKYSLIVVSTLPVLIIYPFLQKYFVKSVMVGAVKG